jgi:hypothetical protein
MHLLTRIRNASGIGLPLALLIANAACAVAPQSSSSPLLLGDFQIAIDGLEERWDRRSLEGSWIVSFRPMHQIVLIRDGQEIVRDTYVIRGDLLELGLAEYGSGECHSMARYRWRITDDALVLTPVHDLCSFRERIFATRPLGRSPRTPLTRR